MTVQRVRRALVGAVLVTAAVLGVAASPAAAAANGQISPASSPNAKWFGQGQNGGVGAKVNPSFSSSNWIFIPSNSFPGNYFIRQRDPLGSGIDLYMDLSGNSASAGIPLVTARFDGTVSQHWTLEKQSGFTGRYRFRNVFSKKYVTFNANGGSAPLRMQLSGATGEQRFDAPPNL